MRFLSADWIFPLHVSPIKEGVLQVSDQGEIINIFESRSEVPFDKLEIFEGLLCPGFINAHCHLELSHLLGLAEKDKGFLDFISTTQRRNDFNEEVIQNAITKAEGQMIKNGIVAVGDICNTSETLLQKQKGNLLYYNFIETFQINEKNIKQTLTSAKVIRDEFRNSGMKATIVPHAPYSVPPKLMEGISDSFDNEDELLTIHMQETDLENQLFENNKGDLYNWLEIMNASSKIWKKRNNSTDILKELERKKILLVHNTFSEKEDIINNYYCSCPKANLYIENSLPDYSIFDTDKLCVGTDSLASNNSLSIIEEILVIQKNSNFNLNTLLKIASKNGAEALGFKNLGTFEKGKKPGINLINKINNVEVI